MYYKNETFPYTDRMLRQELASSEDNCVMLPKVLTDEIRAQYGMHPVTVADQPAHQNGKRIVRDSVPVDGVLGWHYEDMPLDARRAAARTECCRRIIAVVDETSQHNMKSYVLSAQITATLTEAEQQAFSAGVAWIAEMRSAWVEIAEDGTDPSDDANWPPCPENAAAFAEHF